MPGEHGPGGPDPEAREPNIADLKAMAAEFADAAAKGRRPETQHDRDAAILAEMEKDLGEDEKLVNGPEISGEEQARRHLEEVHADMAAQSAVLEAETAIEAPPEDILAISALDTLKHHVAEGPGQKSLMDASADDDFHRLAVNKVFASLHLDSPMAELTADNRNWLRKLIRPKNRKTVNVRKQFDTKKFHAEDGLSGTVTAIRSYNKATKGYELRLYGGQG